MFLFYLIQMCAGASNSIYIFIFIYIVTFDRSTVNDLIAKWQSLYSRKRIQNQTLEQYTTVYIRNKLVPMWPDGWMKFHDIESHFMPSGKAKTKEPKKPTNEPKISKPSLSTVIESPPPVMPIVVDNFKDNNAIMTHNMEKKKSHAVKESTKSSKNANDKPTTHKTDKKHPIITPDRVAPMSLISLPSIDTHTSKLV